MIDSFTHSFVTSDFQQKPLSILDQYIYPFIPAIYMRYFRRLLRHGLLYEKCPPGWRKRLSAKMTETARRDVDHHGIGMEGKKASRVMSHESVALG